MAVCFADASKAKRELGWEATRGLEEMCADSWKWQSNNKMDTWIVNYKNVELNAYDLIH